ncbi:hypothetical protein KCU71_g787, partial [Aureobasidium melanogenum]
MQHSKSRSVPSRNLAAAAQPQGQSAARPQRQPGQRTSPLSSTSTRSPATGSPSASQSSNLAADDIVQGHNVHQANLDAQSQTTNLHNNYQPDHQQQESVGADTCQQDVDHADNQQQESVGTDRSQQASVSTDNSQPDHYNEDDIQADPLDEDNTQEDSSNEDDVQEDTGQQDFRHFQKSITRSSEPLTVASLSKMCASTLATVALSEF